MQNVQAVKGFVNVQNVGGATTPVHQERDIEDRMQAAQGNFRSTVNLYRDTLTDLKARSKQLKG